MTTASSDPSISNADLDRLHAVEERVGHRFADVTYLVHALTHSSIKKHDLPSNERLEFLGDSVLGLVMTEFLYNFYSEKDEGELTQIKSVVVSTRALAAESERLGISEYYNVGKGIGRKKIPVSLQANLFEAVVAAIYKDAGLETARRFILRNLYHHVLAVVGNQHQKNYKSLLQQWVQRERGLTPSYRVVSEKGPDHHKSFEVVAVLGRERQQRGKGRSKKDAEQMAAKATLEDLLGPEETWGESL